MTRSVKPDDRDLLETVDLFLHGDGSGVGGRDLIRQMRDEIAHLRVLLDRERVQNRRLLADDEQAP